MQNNTRVKYTYYTRLWYSAHNFLMGMFYLEWCDWKKPLIISIFPSTSVDYGKCREPHFWAYFPNKIHRASIVGAHYFPTHQLACEVNTVNYSNCLPLHKIMSYDVLFQLV